MNFFLKFLAVFFVTVSVLFSQNAMNGYLTQNYYSGKPSAMKFLFWDDEQSKWDPVPFVDAKFFYPEHDSLPDSTVIITNILMGEYSFIDTTITKYDYTYSLPGVISNWSSMDIPNDPTTNVNAYYTYNSDGYSSELLMVLGVNDSTKYFFSYKDGGVLSEVVMQMCDLTVNNGALVNSQKETYIYENGGHVKTIFCEWDAEFWDTTGRMEPSYGTNGLMEQYSMFSLEAGYWTEDTRMTLGYTAQNYVDTALIMVMGDAGWENAGLQIYEYGNSSIYEFSGNANSNLLKNLINVSCKNGFVFFDASSDDFLNTIEIYTLDGAIVKTVSDINNDSYLVDIRASGVSSGTYIYRARSNKYFVNGRFINK